MALSHDDDLFLFTAAPAGCKGKIALGSVASMSNVYDIAVIGLGAVGSSALHAAAAQGVKAIGFDRYSPPHSHGSTHGETRIMRQAIGEGECYVPLVLRSNAILEGLEKRLSRSLIERCGFLFITRDDQGTSHHGKHGFLSSTQRAAETFGIPHELLDGAELARRFPQFVGLVGDEQAYFEPGGGYTKPEACVSAFLELAEAASARIVRNFQVTGLSPTGGGIEVRGHDMRVVARKVLVAAGPWIRELFAPALQSLVRVHRQTLHWFPVLDDGAYRGPTPTFIWTHGLTSSEQFYGFPPIGRELKVAAEQFAIEGDPDTLAEVNAEEAEQVARIHVHGRLAGVGPDAARSKACLYTVTPDLDFLIDDFGDDIAAVSACSGHGFKHAPAVGEAVVLRALGLSPPVDLEPFRMRRLRAG